MTARRPQGREGPIGPISTLPIVTADSTRTMCSAGPVSADTSTDVHHSLSIMQLSLDMPQSHFDSGRHADLQTAPVM